MWIWIYRYGAEHKLYLSEHLYTQTQTQTNTHIVYMRVRACYKYTLYILHICAGPFTFNQKCTVEWAPFVSYFLELGMYYFHIFFVIVVGVVRLFVCFFGSYYYYYRSCYISPSCCCLAHVVFGAAVAFPCSYFRCMRVCL